jgi:TP901 family phage tail tape measure protein
VFQEVQGDLDKTKDKGKETAEALEKIGEGMKTTGTVVAAVGGALLATLALGAVKAHELEEAFKLVETRADESVLPIEKVRASVLALSNQYGTAQTDLARAYYDAIGLGATTAASSQALVTAAQQLAVGTQTDLKTAMDVTAQAARAFGIPLEQASTVADQLFAASSRGAGSVGDLGESLIHLGPVAAQAGLSSQELLGAVTALAEHGLRGRVAMSGMKGVLDAIAAPTAEAKQQAAALGLTLDKAKIAAMGFGPWLETLANNSHLTAAAMTKLGLGGEASVAVLSLLKNKGADAVEAIGQISDSAGSAADAAEHMTDEFKRLSTLKDNALAALGKGLLDLLSPLVKVANNTLEFFTNLSPATQKLIAGGIALAGVALVLTGVIMAAYGAFLLFDSAAGAAAVAVAILGIEIFALVVGAMAALAVAWFVVKKAWDADLGGIREIVLKLWGSVKLAWDGLTQLFTQGGFSGAVREELDKAGNAGIKNFAITIFLWAHRIEAAWDGISAGFSAAFDAMGPVIADLGGIFTDLAGAFGDIIGGPNDPKKATSAFEEFAAAGRGLGDALSIVAHAMAMTIRIALIPLRMAVALLTGDWDGFKRAALDAFGGVIKGMIAMASIAAGIADKLAGVFGKNLGAGKAVADFGKGLGLDDKGAAGPGGAAVHGLDVAVPTTTIGPDSPAVMAAVGAERRLSSGLKDPTLEQDRRIYDTMAPILQAIREAGNRPIQIHVDGEKIAEVTKAGATRNENRSFGAHPSPG